MSNLVFDILMVIILKLLSDYHIPFFIEEILSSSSGVRFSFEINDPSICPRDSENIKILISLLVGINFNKRKDKSSMDDSTQRYFEAEMRYRGEAGRKFAQAYPDRAAMLNLINPAHAIPMWSACSRASLLMEPPARKLDDDLPELTEGLVSLLWRTTCALFRRFPWSNWTTDHQQMKQSDTLKEFQVLSRPIGERRTRCGPTAPRGISRCIRWRCRTLSIAI